MALARASVTNRVRQDRAERRIDEIVSVARIAADYETADRNGDLNVERQFGQLFQLVDSEAERDAIARTFVIWQHDERIEDLAVRGAVDESVDLLKANNPMWLDGAAVPPDSDGAA